MCSQEERDAIAMANLFEGEGCIGIKRTGNHLYARLTVSMSDEDVVRAFHQRAGCGTVRGPVQRPNRKPMWTWAVGHKAEVRRLLTLWLPYLGERRSAKAREALDHCPVEYRPRGEAFVKGPDPRRGSYAGRSSTNPRDPVTGRFLKKEAA